MQMSDVDPSGADSWRNTGLRNSVLSKIEEALRVSGNITTKSPSDMERHIYSKARSKEEYLSFVARLIIHFKDTSKNKMQAGGGAGGGGASGGGVPQQQQQQQTQQQQMINQQQQQSQQQISLMQQQQQQQQNLQQSQQQQNMQQHQLSALQQQQLQQQMKSNQQQSGPMTIGQQAMTMQQLQQQQQSQQQILSNSNVSLGGMMGNGNNNNNPNVMQNNNAPNGQKMNPMLMNSSLISNVGHGGPNSGNNNMGPTSLDQDNSNNINNSGGVGIVPNMLNMKNAKQQQQLNSGLGMNSNMSGIVNSNLPLNINSQLNQSNVNNTNAGPNSGNMMNSGMSNVGPNNQIVTNLLNSNMKQKLVSNLMPQNSAQGGAGGGIVHSNLINSNLQGGGGPTHVTINQLQAAQQQQQQSGPNSQQQTLSLQQQLAQHHQQQQQQQQQHSQNRMLQPNSTMMMSNANAGRMMLNQGIRQQAGQQSGQINLAPNLQAQLRLRGQSIISGGPNNMQQTMAGLQQQQQQPGQSGPIPIYLQQQQQSQQSMLQPQQQQQQQAMLQQQQSQNQDKFFELSQQQQQSGQQRITPVTISSQGQPPFKTGLLNTSNNPNTINSQSGPFVQTFNANMIPQQSQQPGLPPGQLNVNSSGIGTVVGPGQSIASNSLLQSNQIGGPQSNQGPGQAMLSSGGPQIQQIKQQPQMGPQQMQQQQMQGPNKMLVAPNSAMMQSPSNFHVPSPINPMMSSPAARHSVATLSPQSALNTPASPGAVPPPQQSASQQRSLTSSQEEALYNEKLQSMQKFTGRLLRSIQKLEQEDRKTNDIDKMRNLYNILTEVTRCPLPVLERCEKFLERLEKDQYFKNAKQHTGQPSGPGSGMQQTSDYSPAGSIPSVPSIPPPVQTVANQQLNAGPGGTASQLIATGGAIAATGVVPGSAIASNKLNDICQPLLDSVLKYCDKPMFSHTLHRTFGPALAVLHPEPYQSTNRVNMTGSFVHYSNATCSPILDTYETDEKSGVAVKRRKTEHSFVNTTPTTTTTTTTGTLAHVNLISNILQGEISRLNGRFKIQPLTNNKRLGADTGPKINCKTQNLICRLDDPHLPCIPPLICYIPESYPEISPTFRFEAEQYESSDFFRKIHLNFRSNQAKLRSNFTFTALLHTWERSVRQVIYLVSQAAAAGADQPSPPPPPPLPTQTSTTGTNGNSGSTTTATTTTTNGSTVNNNNNVNESNNKSNLSNIKNKSHITNGIAINPLKQIQLVN